MNRIKSLKNHLFFNVLIIIIPIMILGYITVKVMTERIYDDTKGDNIIVSNYIYNQVNNFINNPINMMTSIKDQINEKKNIDSNQINEMLNSVLSIYPYFDTIQIVDNNGIVKYVAPFDDNHIGTSTVNEQFFTNVDKTGKPVFSNIFISTHTQKPTVTISIYLDGNIIAADLNLSKIVDIVNCSHIDTVENVSILDANGIYLVDNNFENVNERKRYKHFDEIKENILNSEPSTTVSDGEKLLLYSTKLEATGWYSVITMNYNKVFKPVNQIQIVLYLGLLLIILTSLALSLASISRISKGLKVLNNKMELISEGNYDNNLEYIGYVEFEELSNYFNVMKNSIIERENKIIKLNDDLELKVVERTKKLQEEISERKKAEDKIKLLNNNLEKIIEERTNDLIRSYESLEETNAALEEEISERVKIEEDLREAKKEADNANKAKSEFLANMSHEIRTPMNGIMGMTELALMEDVNSATRDYLNLVMTSAQSLLSIINDVLDYSKIEAERIVIMNSPFNLRNSVDEVVSLFELGAKNKGIELNKHIQKSIPNIVSGDGLRLKQVLSNLIGNAVKFTSKGYIRLSIFVDTDSDDSMKLKFVINDTGIGVPKDKQHLLFKRFEQLDSSYTKQYQGTGLGLAISKSLVNLMG